MFSRDILIGRVSSFFLSFSFQFTRCGFMSEFVVITNLYFVLYRSSKVFIKFAGDYGDKGTPLPIPNREVKLVFADGTAPLWRGRVGRCRHFLFVQNAAFFYVTASISSGRLGHTKLPSISRLLLE